MRKNQGKPNADSWLANFRYRRKWRRLTSVLAVFVVIGTIGSLMLPAITLNTYLCGQTEHAHGAECYKIGSQRVLACKEENLGLHTHTEDCLDAERIQICNQVDFAVHEHDDLCRDEKGELVCTLPEIKEHVHDDNCYKLTETVVEEGHTHTDKCYMWSQSATPTCNMEASEPHQHNDACYTLEQKLICTEEDSSHTHGDGCYQEKSVLTCTLTEGAGHKHTEECFGQVRGEALVCGEEERKPVVETSKELTCQKPEILLHAHGGTCFSYDEDGNKTGLICQEPEVLEHRHSDACFAEQEARTLICSLPEHIHTDACREEGATEASDGTDDLSNEASEPSTETSVPTEETQPPLTEEEQLQVGDVISVIEGLPPVEEIEAEFARLENDPEGLAAYRAKILSAVQVAFDEYNALTDAQKAAVTNGAKLESYRYLLEEQKIADVTEAIEALPSAEEIEAELAKLENDPEAQTAYREQIVALIRKVSDDYNALTEEQKALVPNADRLAQYDSLLYKEETLTVSAEGYSLTISCPAEARIPADAVVEMTGIASGSEAHRRCLELAEEKLSGYTIRDARFFDISILSQGKKVQPAGDVTLTITFDEPMAAQVKDLCQFIHFGSEGTELLDGYATRDDNTVSGVTFRQGGFSASGLLLTQPMAVNDADNGPDNMQVDYYIHLNGSWQKVGTTARGWINGYAGGTDENVVHTRDYVTEAQVASILGKYGFKSQGNSARTIFYQPAANAMDSMVWSDTYTTTANGARIIPLSGGAQNYRIYFTPENTKGGNGTNVETLSKLLNGSNTTGNNKFYSVDVQDPQKLVFQSEAEWENYRTVFLHGSNVTITLPKPSKGSWVFYHDAGEKNNDLKFTDNGNGTMSCIVGGLTQHLRVIPDETWDFGPDKMTVDYLVYLDGTWQVVGRTQYGWMGTGTDGSMQARDKISFNQIAGILGPYGFDLQNANARNLAYQQKRDGRCWSDTTFVTIASGQHQCLPLSNNGPGTAADAGYNIYWLPNNTATISNKQGSELPYESNKFWTITVKDDQHWIYEAAELEQVNCLSAYTVGGNVWSYFAAAVQNGHTCEVTVERAGWPWMWFKKNDGQQLHTSTDSSIIFDYADDNHIVMKETNVTQALILDAGDNSWADTSTTGSQSGDKTTVGKDAGITFKLFDYRADINEYLKNIGLVDTPYFDVNNIGYYYQNSKNYFAFRDLYTPWKLETSSSVYDKDGYYVHSDGTPDHSTVYRNLQSGYPLLDLTHHGYNTSVPSVNKTSLGFLFGQTSVSQVKQYNCDNTPLQFATERVNQNGITYEAGYYYYDSRLNAADYNTATNKWYIRNYVERGESTARNYPGYYDFLPFNNGTGGYAGYTTDKNGNQAGYNYNLPNVDYWLGMTMDVNFYTVGDGNITYKGETRPMRFHFSGDDDVYLFVDDILVLDIGGTHGAVDGIVDFSTGLVENYYNFAHTASNHIDSEHRRYTTLYECYKTALQEQGLSDAQVNAKLADTFVYIGQKSATMHGGGTYTYDSYRFKNYTQHSLRFFYMERGADASNCSLSFNLPTLPDEALFVGKELEFTNGNLTPEQINFAKENLTYRFRVVDANDQPIFKNTTVRVYDETLQNEDGTTTLDENGWFTLKAGQRVKFQHMLKALQDLNLPRQEYYVQEAIPSSLVGQYNGVVYKDAGTSGDVTIEGKPGEHNWVIYKTGALSPENTYTVIYTNKVDVEQMSFLQLRKEVQDGSIYTGNETFPVVVKLGGSPVPKGTLFQYTGSTETVSAEEGGIVQLKIGKTLQLSAPILAGTLFEVKENSSEGWSLVGYTTTYTTTDGSTSKENASGEIPLDATVTVTITNRTNAFSVPVPITKEFRGGKADVTREATFRMEQVTDQTGTTVATTKYPTTIQDITISCIGGNITTGEFHLNYDATTPAGTYYYRITETGFKADPSEMFIKDDTVYVVEVLVKDASARVNALYVGGTKQAGTTPAFVNPFATVELPDCGGTGTTLYTFSGWAVMLTACALMYNTKRKQRKGAR